jgi:hypothetical protein
VLSNDKIISSASLNDPDDADINDDESRRFAILDEIFVTDTNKEKYDRYFDPSNA